LLSPRLFIHGEGDRFSGRFPPGRRHRQSWEAILLHVNGINTFYFSVQVLRDVSFDIAAGEIVSIVGANGAGKTTIMKTVSGLLSPRSGEVQFLGERIDRLPPHKIVEKGLIQIAEGRKLFATLSVMENLTLGAFHRSAKKKRSESRETVFGIFPTLRERKDQIAGTLSGGEQQMLAIGRGLMSLPKLLMLDEPSLGLAPLMVKEIFGVVTKINGQGTTILLVEQNIKHSLALASRGYVLENGKIILSGNSADLLSNEHTKKAYLGM
jgi:branched-chain amino acid transport system ATP-binding protein